MFGSGNNRKNDCLKYWNLTDSLKIDAIVALWCGVEPSELRTLGFQTSCMDAKRVAIEDALIAGRLDYIDEGTPSAKYGKWFGSSVDELIQKNCLRIPKDELRKWFLQLDIDDRPAFLFDEAIQEDIPDNSEAAELATHKAIAIMAIMLSQNKTAYNINDRPNSKAIGNEIYTLATKYFGDDTRGLKAFHKKVSRALNDFENNLPLSQKKSGFFSPSDNDLDDGLPF